MTGRTTFDAIVSSLTEPYHLEGDRGIIFRVRTSRAEEVQVFLPVSRAELVDEVDLSAGAKLRIEGEQLDTGIVVVLDLSPSPGFSLEPEGRLLGTVDIPIPALSRLNPWRERRYKLILWGGIAAVLAVGIIGMTTDNAVGNVAMPLFLALCAWLVVGDLLTRRVDNREYAALARTAAEAIQAGLHVPVPEAAVVTLLGGGLERTGNPWNPTRPQQPRAVSWRSGREQAVLHADITPKPLRPNSTATITITSLEDATYAERMRTR
ncbi:hypothetical protein MJA45_28295 [Paenibacillus aurantius]|uniref:Uncharacterized protein n=1 Tax=Paenibacillus aurantius TaxID=2918900 RepID=A0AA96LG31_9BACL|nr:hypothetical protein [Paenibacillus aurantius]WNQ11450.1 hypothetical protein MJA45_28295 [Paenibacillus aurantius]